MSDTTQPLSLSRPRLGIVDVGLLLWRAKWLMLLVFLPILVGGVYFATTLPTEYYASSRVFVSLGDEYVFRPRVGGQINNNVPELEELIQNEIELMRSPIVAERMVQTFGAEVLFPGRYAKITDIPEDIRADTIEEGIKKLYPKLKEGFDEAETEQDAYEVAESGIERVQDNFTAFATPKQSVIQTNFGHPNAAMSADILNRLLDVYLEYRSEVFEDTSPIPLRAQRIRFEEALAEAEDELRQFLAANEIGNFDAERQAAQALFASVEAAILENETLQSQLNGQITILRLQLRQTPSEIDLFTEDSSSQSIATLELEREDLLARYTPESQAVQDIDARIARAREYVNSQERPVGTVRRGQNPLYQQIQTSLSTLSSQAEATRQQHAELTRQAADIRTRQARIIDLEPIWQKLIRERDLLESSLRDVSTREVEARTLAEIAQQDSDNIRILEQARQPIEGSSLKLITAVLSLLFAGFCALIVGLLSALSKKGFATPQSLERTLGLPVVTTVGHHK